MGAAFGAQSNKRMLGKRQKAKMHSAKAVKPPQFKPS